MIGNDLVWLKDSDNCGRANDSRLKNRIFSSSEALAFENSAQTDRILWSLWAAKEGAFKALSRQMKIIFFHPQEFIVSQWDSQNPMHGIVTYQSRSWAVTWHQARDWVHAVVHPFGQSFWSRVGRWVASESNGTREWAGRRLQFLFGEGCRVEGQPPVFHRSQAGETDPISLSHDGPFSALAILFKDPLKIVG